MEGTGHAVIKWTVTTGALMNTNKRQTKLDFMDQPITKEINMEKKAEFLEIFHRDVTRRNHDRLLAYLEKETDFFTAPASTKYHGAHPGGLVEHSLNVYHRLLDFTIRDTLDGPRGLWPEHKETVAVVGLLHDVCKADCYHRETKRRKNPESGRWEEYQAYTFHDPLPLGHGEKSLYIITQHMALTPEEAMAIRWHMGAYDEAVKGGSRAMAEAMKLSPWVWRLQEADMCAVWVDEREAGSR